MASLPLVSIVTPSFNQAAYLEQTLCSVLDQDYPRLEYWVMDGGSTDGSVEIIRRYESRLAGWVSEPDRGQGDAINKGFARAGGEIIAWLNSDDVYLPGAVRRAVAALQSDPTLAMVYGDVRSIDGEGQTIGHMRYADWGLDGLMAFRIIGQPGVFMRREAFASAGGLDLSYHYLLDHHLWLRVAQQGSIRHVPEEWAAARFHAGAKNVAQAGRFGQEALRIADWLAGDLAYAEPYARNRARVWAGAHRMDARYLLDGGRPGAALKAYGRSLAAHPGTALAEWHRMVYALLSLAGLNRLGAVYYRLKRRRLQALEERRQA
ncbi:MAG TPA: glycosyltransferase family 2 protein [Anaerolineaceae bacterium]|nr:glycosyltransferase family 2 protein [Anaerolineaceae bacterium]